MELQYSLVELAENRDFENYLSYLHAQDYTGLDDDMPDAFIDWLDDKSEEEMFEHLSGFLWTLKDHISPINYWSSKRQIYPKS